MRFELRLDIFALFILIGLSQGIFLVYFYLMKRNRNRLDNRFFAMLLITFVIILSEIFLNYTGLIVKVIRIENYSEPFVFLIMPLLYLMMKSRIGKDYSSTDHVHFFPFVFYFLYCFLYFLQSDEFKYNSYVYCYKPGWSNLDVKTFLPEDPLLLRHSLATLYISQFVVYLYLILIMILEYKGSNIDVNARRKAKTMMWNWIHAFLITILIIYIKFTYERDLGDYLIGTYIALVLYATGFLTLTNQFNARHIDVSTQEAQKQKYEKSSLTEEKKTEILNKLQNLFENDKYFKGNTISLADTAKAIGEASHHLSQAINEKLNKTFFELLSEYRIEEAKRILKETPEVTIEDIADQVGYNSKAAFNKAFKTTTGKTPSEYRKEFL